MTENKRFTITQDFEEHHRQIRDNGHIIMGCFVKPQAEVIVNLLNELSEENEQLKIRFNEEREKSLKFCRNIDTLTIENEHIKNTIQEAYNSERTQIGQSVLKQLMENVL